jgi:hypothetical protein
MRTELIVALLLSCAFAQLRAQPLIHPWNVIPTGGTTSSRDDMRLIVTVGQPAITPGASGTLLLEPGYIAPLRFFTGAIASCQISMAQGWNMVAVPLLVDDYTKTTLFPSASSPAYTFNNGYVVRDTLSNGAGYWIKFAGPRTINMHGTACTMDTFDVIAGWNMVGALAYPILATDVSPISPVTITSSFYAYVPGAGYHARDTLEEGAGYWVKTSQAGKLVMNSGSVLLSGVLAAKQQGKDRATRPAGLESESIQELKFTDAAGNTRSLFFSATPDIAKKPRFELPPPPPEGIMDVRFRSQRMLETPEKPGPAEFPVCISSAQLPLRIDWNLSSDASEFALELTFAGEEPQVHSLSGQGKLSIARTGFIEAKVVISPAFAPEPPKEYALAQNYPNPFNPLTSIRYDLPAASRVSLKMYNLLGQEVGTLVDELQEAGFKSVHWDASGIASGVYFCRLKAGDFVQTKRMMLLR